MVQNKAYDVLIIGGGPAGLAAGLYAARSRLSCLLVDKIAAGGKAVNAEIIENYPGFPDGIPGYDLSQLMEQQARKFGLEFATAEVNRIDTSQDIKKAVTADGELLAKAVIIACGSDWQKLGVPGEAELLGRGVSYCATCDAALYYDKVVAVIGGGNAAVNEALQLAKFASKVVVIHRRDQLRATPVVRERAMALPKIEFIWDSAVERIAGKDFVESLNIRNIKTGQESRLSVDGVFVAVGLKPQTEFLKGTVLLDANGYIITNEKMETVLPGILAAGDVRANSIRQVVAACGDGAVAAVYAENYLNR